ncbi:MAG: methyltransferase domain-containing protein [Actinobacteria bacterium]|nr:methyltransferase domain-containing protein [Actinomycetota bacterium]
MSDDNQTDEAARLEDLWAGDFGDAYVDRNADSYEHRRGFWESLLDEFPCHEALEIGCNVGGNLRWLASKIEPSNICGIDINEKSLRAMRERVPGAVAVSTPARQLPFRDRQFDLVFTMGVLIHQPEDSLPFVMDEMVRCSRKWVFCGEYFATQTEEVPYRDQSGALFRRDYGSLFSARFPTLSLVQSGFLGRDDGWDDVTWWIFERS